MTNEKVWLFITRAQPWLHAGQVDGIRQAIAQWITKIIIWVWSANKEFTSENPFTYDERKKMIELSAKELLQDIDVEVFPVPDMWDNEKWRNYIFNNLPEFQYIATGNAWVQEVFKDSDKTIIPIEIREYVKWSTIRWNLATNNIEELEKVLPKSVIEYLESISAFQRLKEIFEKERKSPTLVADMVLLINKKWKKYVVLIMRKNFPKWPALPWWVINYGETCSDGGVRETDEELWVKTKVKRFLWIRDKSDRDPRSHNISTAFEWEIIWWELEAWDDAESFFLADVNKLDELKFAFPDHREIIEAALKNNIRWKIVDLWDRFKSLFRK